jgi:predicted nuclease with TOPRIM domain
MEEKQVSNKDKISDKFTEERNNVSLDIRRNVEKLNNIKNLKEVQIFFLSTRQRLLEENHTLMEHLSKLKRNYRDKKGKAWETVSNLNMRYQAHEKKVIVDGKITNIQETIEIIENQISFFSETIKTVDNVLFGLKTRLDLEKLLG